ncbi:unnamed protein product [Urochloa humidicola]
MTVLPRRSTTSRIESIPAKSSSPTMELNRNTIESSKGALISKVYRRIDRSSSPAARAPPSLAGAPPSPPFGAPPPVHSGGPRPVGAPPQVRLAEASPPMRHRPPPATVTGKICRGSGCSGEIGGGGWEGED